MKINSAEYVISSPDLAGCPETIFPEVAFIGRSNVGKSSLINLLTQRKNLAKVSATPGKTRLINFFLINQKWMLVDLPGYGYAKVSKILREDFGRSIRDYLTRRKNLSQVYLLIDARLPPQKIDLAFLQWSSATQLPLALVFTKADKAGMNTARGNAHAFLESARELLPSAPPLFFSATGDIRGRNEILHHIHERLAETAQ